MEGQLLDAESVADSTALSPALLACCGGCGSESSDDGEEEAELSQHPENCGNCCDSNCACF